MVTTCSTKSETSQRKALEINGEKLLQVRYWSLQQTNTAKVVKDLQSRQFDRYNTIQ